MSRPDLLRNILTSQLLGRQLKLLKLTFIEEIAELGAFL